MFAARDELAAAFGLRKDAVRVRTEFVGGGFGAKQGRASRRSQRRSFARITGRPVRLVNDRHGEMLDGGRPPSTRADLRLGATRDGTLTAIEAEAVAGDGPGRLGDADARSGPHALPCADVGALSFPARTNLRPRTRSGPRG